VEFHVADLESFQPDSPFDVITVFDMLMYVPSPIVFLDHARQCLRPEGYLVIKAIHFPISYFRLLNLILSPMRLRGQALLHVPTARYHFSPGSLARLVEPRGFQMVGWEHLPNLPRTLTWSGVHGVRDTLIRAVGDWLTRATARTSHFVACFRVGNHV
jgi:hypothetical protein